MKKNATTVPGSQLQDRRSGEPGLSERKEIYALLQFPASALQKQGAVKLKHYANAFASQPLFGREDQSTLRP